MEVDAFESSFVFGSSFDTGFEANRLGDAEGFCSVLGVSVTAGFGTNKVLNGLPPAGWGFSCSEEAVFGANKLPVDGGCDEPLNRAGAVVVL